jgi:uncharacterized protein (DUF2141 family)
MRSELVMSKMHIPFLALLGVALVPVSSAHAAVLGPDAARCVAGEGPAVLVRVTGLKSRVGAVRARTFAGNKPSSWFDKKQALKRTEVQIPDAGTVEICMPVPRAGTYVVDLRHDVNGSGKTDRSDGAGASGNPQTSLFDFLLGKKPPASQVTFQVNEGVTTISIVMKYLQGGSFKPIQITSR